MTTAILETMAILYDAALNPTKLDLLGRWLPTQSWFDGGDAELASLGSFRFDDPDGEVGLESHLVAADGVIYHAPLTYRGTELDGGSDSLIGTMEHSVLGRRWIYDACGDPVYAAALAATLLAGRAQAEQWVDHGDRYEELPSPVRIAVRRAPDGRASGGAPGGGPGLGPHGAGVPGAVVTIRAGDVSLTVNRVVDLTGVTNGRHVMVGTWPGRDTPVQLAAVLDG